ncbi:hypothetical protein ERJ75_001374500 [Trypanosoma vivax]|nr:hypothetical protein ERJ75_001374500 [Trypanosoma vivax]
MSEDECAASGERTWVGGQGWARNGRTTLASQSGTEPAEKGLAAATKAPADAAHRTFSRLRGSEHGGGRQTWAVHKRSRGAATERTNTEHRVRGTGSPSRRPKLQRKTKSCATPKGAAQRARARACRAEEQRDRGAPRWKARVCAHCEATGKRPQSACGHRQARQQREQSTGVGRTDRKRKTKEDLTMRQRRRCKCGCACATCGERNAWQRGAASQRARCAKRGDGKCGGRRQRGQLAEEKREAREVGKG